jgi:5-methylcytosine-specific restriction endonuclease McrA
VFRAVLAPDPLFCGLCGGWIDKRLPRVTIRGVPPHPMSAVVDHIREVDQGGDPLDPENLQPMHRRCNEIKEARRRTLSAAARRNEGELIYGQPMRRKPKPIIGADP